MSNQTLVTAALIYANGSVHIGHLVEYIQTDIFVRALKLMGEDAIYICADDTHGTPIEVNAKKAGITPEEFIQRFYDEHYADFQTFKVAFDCFHSTNSPENKKHTELLYNAVKKANSLSKDTVDGFFCEHDKRFLPDRFVKGTCPKCGAEDQYGDVCEVCSATYEPTEVKNPRCVLCDNQPVIKESEHLFFHVEPQADFLSGWIKKSLNVETANFVQQWIKEGLKPWCISRDGPYFGFTIPDMPEKYFYVWFDAPIGYIASTDKYCQEHGKDPLADYWNNPEAKIIHVIGKDIVYFHSLFWPAVLKTANYTMPQRIQVHGFLTVNGEKMSKSRGTFITAKEFSQYADPEYLRYFYATHLNNKPDDLDLNFEEFQNRINAELVNKMANLVNRVSNFLNKNFDGILSDYSEQEVPMAAEINKHMDTIKEYYCNFEFSKVTREICAIADIGNLYFQDNKPWELIKSDKEQVHKICTITASICQALAISIKPIMPDFSTNIEKVLDIEPQDFQKQLWQLSSHKIGATQRLLERFDKQELEKLVEEKTKTIEAQTSKPEIDPIGPEIGIEDFLKADLRTGKIITAEKLPKSKKLVKLQIDIGEAQPRQVLAGIALTFEPEQLIGKWVIVVANLKPAKLMGQESQGMVLAIGKDPTSIRLLTPDGDCHPGEKVS